MKKQGKLINKTDMILIQKETEKLARDALVKINQNKANGLAENDIVMDWCYSSIFRMMQTMTIYQCKNLCNKVKDYVQERKNLGAGATKNLNQTYSQTHHDLEMVKHQDQIDTALDRIRAVIIDKTMESD